MKLGILIVAAAVGSQPLPTQFDLVCEGEFQSGFRKEPSQFRYVVDLAAMKWCKNAETMTRCPKVNVIERVDESRYTFRDSKPNAPADWDYVDRQTGESNSYDAKFGFRQMGKCEVGPFSGFPVPKL